MDALRTGAIFSSENMSTVRSLAQSTPDINRMPSKHHIDVNKEAFECIYKATCIPAFLLQENNPGSNGQLLCNQQKLLKPTAIRNVSFQHNNNFNFKTNGKNSNSDSDLTFNYFITEPPVARGDQQTHNSSECLTSVSYKLNSVTQNSSISGDGSSGNSSNYNIHSGKMMITSSFTSHTTYRECTKYREFGESHDSAVPQSASNRRHDRPYSRFSDFAHTKQFAEIFSPVALAAPFTNSPPKQHPMDNDLLEVQSLDLLYQNHVHNNSIGSDSDSDEKFVQSESKRRKQLHGDHTKSPSRTPERTTGNTRVNKVSKENRDRGSDGFFRVSTSRESNLTDRQSSVSQSSSRKRTQSSRTSISRTNYRTSGQGDSLLALFANGQKTEKRVSSSAAAQLIGDSMAMSSICVASSLPQDNKKLNKGKSDNLSISSVNSSSPSILPPPAPVTRYPQTVPQPALQTLSQSSPMFVIHQPLVRKKNPTVSAVTTTRHNNSSDSSGISNSDNLHALSTHSECPEKVRKTLMNSNQRSRSTQHLLVSENRKTVAQHHAVANKKKRCANESNSDCGRENIVAVTTSADVSASKQQLSTNKPKTKKWLPEERQELYAVCSLFPDKSAEKYWSDVAIALSTRLSRARTSEECRLYWEEVQYI